MNTVNVSKNKLHSKYRGHTRMKIIDNYYSVDLHTDLRSKKHKNARTNVTRHGAYGRTRADMSNGTIAGTKWDKYLICTSSGKVLPRKEFINYAIRPKDRLHNGFNIRCRALQVNQYTTSGYLKDGFTDDNDKIVFQNGKVHVEEHEPYTMDNESDPEYVPEESDTYSENENDEEYSDNDADNDE